MHSVICRNLPIFVFFVNNGFPHINVEKLQIYLNENLLSTKMVAVSNITVDLKKQLHLKTIHNEKML